MSNLYIYPKTGDALTYALVKERTSIGRSQDNDVVVADQFCSNHHALIALSEKGFIIQDLGSKNGVHINGRRISFETVLNRGDDILMGSTRIVFDQEVPTRVEMVEESPGLQDYNTIIQVRDFLKKPPPSVKPRTQAQPEDLDRLRREQKVLSVLNEVSQALIYHFPLDKLLDHIMDLMIQNIPMDRGVLMLNEGKPVQLIPKVVRVMDPALKTQNIQVSRSILNTVLAKNSAILVSDAQSDSFFKEQASVVRSNIRSIMCVPLWNNENIVGIIYADKASLTHPFSEDDLKLLTLLANVAAVKIENAKLIEETLEKYRIDRELDLAAQIQRNLLPKEDPQFENYEFSGANKGCFQIGGDYYDFIPIASGRLAIAIGDVSGCGVGPALLMASLRASLHAEFGPGYDLTQIAARLNDFVHKSSESHTFITFFFGELDIASGELNFVNAGHNPPIILDSGGGVRRLESTGFSLGMFPGVSYDSGSVRLVQGDLVCLFTDGITECRNKENAEFGEERLLALLRKHSGLPVSQIMDKLFGEVREFTGTAEPGDDMTLIIIRRTG